MKHVVADRDRYGKVRHYLRRPGCRKVRLMAEPGTPEFAAEYDRAMRLPPQWRKRSSADRPRRAFVYVIAAGRRAVKVGHAREVQKRLVELQVGNPVPLRLVALYAAADSAAALRVEKAAHRRLASYRCAGEWFAVSIRGAAEAIAAAAAELGAVVHEYASPARPAARRRAQSVQLRKIPARSWTPAKKNSV